MSNDYKAFNITLYAPSDYWDEPNFGGYWESDLGHIGYETVKLLGCPKCGVVMILKNKHCILGGLLNVQWKVICPSCDAHFLVDKGKITPTWII
jgi:predicted RNA-binding Zn-ribbon protein involved in translation (DUF1610 family)